MAFDPLQNQYTDSKPAMWQDEQQVRPRSVPVALALASTTSAEVSSRSCSEQAPQRCRDPWTDASPQRLYLCFLAWLTAGASDDANPSAHGIGLPQCRHIFLIRPENVVSSTASGRPSGQKWSRFSCPGNLSTAYPVCLAKGRVAGKTRKRMATIARLPH